CADSIRAHNNYARTLFMRLSFRVIINGSTSMTFSIKRNLTNARPRFKNCACLQCLGPVGHICASSSFGSTSVPSLAAEITSCPAIIRTGKETQIADPPMPSQLVERSSGDSPCYTQREWREPRCVNGIGWIAQNSRNAHLPIIRIVVRFKILIADWPVLRDSIQRFGAKVRSVRTLEFANPKNCASSDTVHHFDVRRISTP